MGRGKKSTNLCRVTGRRVARCRLCGGWVDGRRRWGDSLERGQCARLGTAIVVVGHCRRPHLRRNILRRRWTVSVVGHLIGGRRRVDVRSRVHWTMWKHWTTAWYDYLIGNVCLFPVDAASVANSIESHVSANKYSRHMDRDHPKRKYKTKYKYLIIKIHKINIKLYNASVVCF